RWGFWNLARSISWKSVHVVYSAARMSITWNAHCCAAPSIISMAEVVLFERGHDLLANWRSRFRMNSSTFSRAVPENTGVFLLNAGRRRATLSPVILTSSVSDMSVPCFFELGRGKGVGLWRVGM